MRRRFSTRDIGLDLRLLFALAVIVGIYAVWIGLLVALLVSSARDGSGRGILASVLFLVGTPWLLWKHYADSANDTLRLTRARPEAETDVFVPVAAKLAAQADVREPDVLLARSALPNALAVPTRGKPLVVVTKGLLELEPKEIEAVIAHEITHIANRDGAVMTFVGGPALAAAALWHGRDLRGKFAAILLSPVWLVGILLMRAVSRYREYAADRGSALLTGAPEQLMSALTKIHGVQPRGDLRGGATISALCIRSLTGSASGLLSDHPPLRKRLARLEAMAREQGRPVGA